MHKNSYQIVLTEDEANTLYVLTSCVWGDVERSPRKHCDSVYYKLKNMLGGKSNDLEERKLLTTEVNFKNYPTKTPQQLKIEELENTINEAQKQLQELKGL